MWKRLTYLVDYANIPPAKELTELLPVLDDMNNCPYRNDSTHAFLLRRIGANYFKKGDCLEAIRYYRESIKVTSENKNKSVRQKDLILSYYFLGVFYGSLNNVSEKMKALDSCIAYARRLNTPSDIACVAALYQKVEYYFDIGDYQRCIEYAIMCEKFALEYASHETEKRNVEVGRQNAESSLLWRVKALLVLKEYDQAEKLLTNKLEEYKKWVSTIISGRSIPKWQNYNCTRKIISRLIFSLIPPLSGI
ncbi:MAG: hypothetical protein E6H10_19035 [Bacteroidetes bacterium]|nr:MAG: hypothetical protein E6H10_19035 [Bacteroidota bacterium]